MNNARLQGWTSTYPRSYLRAVRFLTVRKIRCMLSPHAKTYEKIFFWKGSKWPRFVYSHVDILTVSFSILVPSSSYCERMQRPLSTSVITIPSHALSIAITATGMCPGVQSYHYCIFNTISTSVRAQEMIAAFPSSIRVTAARENCGQIPVVARDWLQSFAFGCWVLIAHNQGSVNTCLLRLDYF